MKAPLKWMRDYVQIGDAEDFRRRMVDAGNAVESVENLGEEIQNVVAGKIIKIERHPDADKLLVCRVDAGAETVQIVTGADNVFEGALIPVALHGAVLPTGQKIKKGKLRGVESEGMMCSGEELNLTEGDYEGAGIHGILILKEDAQPGTDIRDVLGLKDTVFEFEVGANRPDCLSIAGLCREASAVLDAPMTEIDVSFKEEGGDVHGYVGAEVLDTVLCPRYIARAVRNVKIGPSPRWMKERLRAAGVRPINNIVDITNYVMLEMGQPMHAFDLNDIQGSKIIVRRALPGEKMVTLDGKERELSQSMLMICDAKRPIGIAGVMGGENSEIKDDTKTVIFEAAKFTYANIRQTSRSLGLLTESAMRFSKGVDAVTTALAMARALHLVQELHAGEVVSGEIDILNEDISPRRVTASAARINALLGTEVPAVEMASILNRLHIATRLTGDTLSCKVPSYRGDIEGGADLAEEVARLHGYDNIPLKKMCGDIIPGRISPEQALRDQLKTMLVHAGFYECVTYSFGSAAALDKLALPEDDPLRTVIRVKNPLGDDKSVMRTTPAADMLNVVYTNLNKKAKDIRLFEAGYVYRPKALPLTELPEELPYFCLALCGEGEDFYTLKGTVENLLWRLNIGDAVFTPGGPAYLHPGRRAVVTAGDVEIGCIGEVHPDTAQNFELDGRVYLAELYIKPLLVAADPVRKYRALPRYPGVERDLAFTVDRKVTAGSLRELIRKEGGRHLESVELFDFYEGEKLGADKKSLAYSLVFRAEDRTLTDAEAAKAISRIVDACARDLGAELRK